MITGLPLESASLRLNWSNILYVGGAALTVVSAMYVLYENRAIAAGKRIKFYLLSEIAVLAAAFVGLVGTIGAIHYGNLVSHLKDADLAAYKTGADLKIAQANRDAAQAKSDAATANQRAEEAKLKAEFANSANFNLRLDVAKQQKARLEAEAKLGAQNKENFDFAHALAQQQQNMAQQAHVSPILDGSQITALAAGLRSFAGEDVIVHSTSDTTVLRLVSTVDAALDIALVKHTQSSIDMGSLYQGVSVVVHSPQSVPPIANALVLGLRQAGIVANPVSLPTVPEGKVALYFGPN